MNSRPTIPYTMNTSSEMHIPHQESTMRAVPKAGRRPKYMGHMPLTSRTIKSNARLSRPSVSGTRFEAHTRYFTVHVTDQPRQ